MKAIERVMREFAVVSTLALALGLAWHGALPAQVAGVSLLALLPALAGMALGGWLRARVRPATSAARPASHARRTPSAPTSRGEPILTIRRGQEGGGNSTGAP